MIAYDVASTPMFKKDGAYITAADIVLIQKESGYLFYDSKLGRKPEILSDEEKVKIVDFSEPKWRIKLNLIIRGLKHKLLIRKLKK